MIVIIQCASSKRSDAGFLRDQDNNPVKFVAEPTKAPPTDQYRYARPDDPSDYGSTWRNVLLKYNGEAGANPLGLSAAYELYDNRVYRRLAARFGVENLYILSAGWGLISASFLTPNYDITFSQAAKRTAPWKFRGKADIYQDLCMLPQSSDEPLIFFGGKDYVPLFCNLTEPFNVEKTIFYNAISPPLAPGCSVRRFNTRTRTNWHYECAHAFIDGKL